MTRSSMIVRSSVVGSFALLVLFACERENAEPGGAREEGIGTSPGTEEGLEGNGTLGAGEAAPGARSGRTSGTEPSEMEGIERTGGRDMPLGGAGSAGAPGTLGGAGSGGGGGMGGGRMP